MKRIILQFCIAAGLAFASSAGVLAQASHTYRAHIPFDFAINDKVMAAGDYRISPLTSPAGVSALQLVNLQTNKGRLLGVVSQGTWSAERDATLTFVRDGDEYLLANIDAPSFTMQMPKVTAKARVITQVNKKPSTVTIAMY